MSSEPSRPNNQIILILLGACANHAALLYALAHKRSRSEGTKEKPIADLIRVVANMKPRTAIARELFRGTPGSEKSKKGRGLAHCWKELCEADTAEWYGLHTWKFVEQVMVVFAAVKADELPWRAVWSKVSIELRKCSPPGNIEWMCRELNEQYQRLQGERAALPTVLPAEAEHGRRSELENVNTLPELREWLKVRMRWLRDWHMAPEEPKPIPATFLDVILSLYGKSRYSPPNDPTKVRDWANLWIMRFAVHTIHEVHDWLETHDTFGGPDCPTLDIEKDERILPLTLEHLSRLLNFIGTRAREQSAPGVPSEGERAEVEGRCQRRNRGRPADTDLQLDKRIFDAWQAGHFKTYDELAGEFKLKKSAVKLSIDRERKRRKK